jgi:hypothetical protein
MAAAELPESVRAPWRDIKNIIQVERLRVTDDFTLQRK